MGASTILSVAIAACEFSKCNTTIAPAAATTATTSSPTMADTTNPSAAVRALDTVELLENILIYLDTRTLLLSQRTTRTFRSTITQSPSLQTALFFRPPRTLHAAEQTANTQITLNPLLINPAITVPNCGFRLRITIRMNGKGQVVVSYHLEIVGVKLYPPDTASWQRMFLSDTHFVSVYGEPPLSCGVWKSQVEPFVMTRVGESSMRAILKEVWDADAIYEPHELSHDPDWLMPNPRLWLKDLYTAAFKEMQLQDADPEKYEEKLAKRYEEAEDRYVRAEGDRRPRNPETNLQNRLTKRLMAGVMRPMRMAWHRIESPRIVY